MWFFFLFVVADHASSTLASGPWDLIFNVRGCDFTPLISRFIAFVFLIKES